MQVVLGIDGGGTKTRCLAADLTGHVLGEGLAGPSNYQVVGLEAAAANLFAAADGALGQAGQTRSAVAAAVAGLAGVGRPEDQAAMRGALAGFAPAALEVVPDARIALAGALGGQPGVVVISGTGSIAYGLDAGGRTVRAGGWGWILGDEGSGYYIGRSAVSAALAALDGTGEQTVLSERIQRAWNLERLDLAVRRVYADLPAAKADMAALVPLVLEVAGQGDAVAAGILRKAGADLAGVAAAVLRRLALPDACERLVAVTGGVLTGSAAVREAMRAHLTALVPGARLMESLQSPAEGAVRMALALAATGR
jgi:N-acetylglucosamine kinase-like BadF-type ATPase